MITTSDIAAAAARIEDRTVRTPLLPCQRLSEGLGVHVWLKAENLQHTGSFKVRGVFNALLARHESGQSVTGVATFSAGNHAAATAFAGRSLGLPVVVCMPAQAVVTKVEAVRRYGGEVVFTDDLLGTCRQLAAERGYELLHPFDDPSVIAGQATVGAEIIAGGFVPDLVLVPVGGGGLISGVSAAIKGAATADAGSKEEAGSTDAGSKEEAGSTEAGSGEAARRTATRIVGVEPITANAMSQALRIGAPEPLPQRPTSMADGLTAPFAGEHTLAHVRAHVDEILEVDEDSIRAAWWDMLDQTKLLMEPSAAVPLAAIRLGLVPLQPGQQVVFVISGGNTSPAALASLAETEEDAMRPDPGQVLHFSEDPTIVRFEPHVAATAQEPEAYVWAVDHAHSPSYWFPRHCPRGMAWAVPTTTASDRDRIIGAGSGARVHAIEYGWLTRLQTTRLYAYRLDAAFFRPYGESGAPHAFVATEPVEPLGPAEPVGDLLACHEAAGIQLRLLDNLWPYWDEVIRSTLGFSGIRMRNARPRPATAAASSS